MQQKALLIIFASSHFFVIPYNDMNLGLHFELDLESIYHLIHKDTGKSCPKT